MTPFRPLLKDYFLLCESYYSAIRSASPRQIEAIERERAALHNHGAKLIAERLAEKVRSTSAPHAACSPSSPPCAGRYDRG